MVLVRIEYKCVRETEGEKQDRLITLDSQGDDKWLCSAPLEVVAMATHRVTRTLLTSAQVS